MAVSSSPIGTEEQPKPQGRAGGVGAEEAARETKTGERQAGDRKDQGRRLVDDAREAVADVANQSKNWAADVVSSIAQAVDSGAAELSHQGHEGAASLIREASRRIQGMGRGLQGRQPGEMWIQMEDIARRQPILCFGATALAGFLGARFLMTSANRADRRLGLKDTTSYSANEEMHE